MYPVKSAVRVTDRYGNLLAEKAMPWGLRLINPCRLVIPERQPGTCPVLGVEQYMLEVRNRCDYPVRLLAAEEELGVLDPRSTSTLGPYNGPYAAVERSLRAEGMPDEELWVLDESCFAIAAVPIHRLTIDVNPSP